MDSARQLLRWSLPGLVFVLNVVVFHGIWLLVVNQKSPWGFINEATAPALVAVVAGGLPAGFLLYQLYFHSYRPYGSVTQIFKASVGPRFYRRDRGATILRSFKLEYSGDDRLILSVDPKLSAEAMSSEIFSSPPLVLEGPRLLKILGTLPSHIEPHTAEHRLELNTRRCKRCGVIYSERSDRNWILVQMMIDYAASKEDRRWIKTEYTSGSDLYHALGASQTAMWVAGVIAILYQVSIATIMAVSQHQQGIDTVWRPVVALAIIFFVTLLEVRVFRGCRDNLSMFYEKRLAAALALASRTIAY